LSTLDDVDALGKLDAGGMLRQVAALPAQLARGAEVRRAFHAADRLAGAVAAVGAREVLVCGMGGSAIGADFAAVWAASHGVRLSVWRGYGLPAWVGRQHLLVFSSYSGNTEETLAAFDDSPPDAARVCITTGGALARRARATSVACLELPPGLQPRAALGHSLVALLTILHGSRLVAADPVADLEQAARAVRRSGDRLGPEVPEAANAGKQLARQWHGHLPLFYAGDGCLGPVALRWKGQLNENAEAHAFASMLPEMNHNEIMAWSALPDLRRRMRLFFLHDPHDDARVAMRLRLTAELLAAHAASVHDLTADGDTCLEHMLTMTQLGDFASVYAAFLNGADPTPVARIEALKTRMSAGS